MTPQPPRSHTKLTITIVGAALLIGAAIYASSLTGTSATITRTSTVTTTVTSTASTPSGVRTNASIQIPTSSASTQDTSLGLTLGLHISANATGALSIYANEANVLDRVNNVTTANNWSYPNTEYPCGNWAHFPIQYALFQGYYDTNNYTTASALMLYDTGEVYTCPTLTTPAPYLLFAPLSDNASNYMSGGEGSFLISAGDSYTGYWTGSGTTASFHKFQPGVYTVLAEDEWGSVVLLHFNVTASGSGSATSSMMAKSVSGGCLEEVPQSAVISKYYSSTSQGNSVTYSNGTQDFFPLDSCPVPVGPDNYEVDSTIEADPMFIAAENGSVYQASPFGYLGPSEYDFSSGSYTCMVPGPNGTYTRMCTEYATLAFDLYSSQKVYGCGGSTWIYERLGEIQVRIPLNATGGLELSRMTIRIVPESGLNVILCTTTTTYTGGQSISGSDFSAICCI